MTESPAPQTPATATPATPLADHPAPDASAPPAAPPPAAPSPPSPPGNGSGNDNGNGNADDRSRSTTQKILYLAIAATALIAALALLVLTWPPWPEPSTVAAIDPGPVSATRPDTMPTPGDQRLESELPRLATDPPGWRIAFPPTAWHETNARAAIAIVPIDLAPEAIRITDTELVHRVALDNQSPLPTIDSDATTCLDRPLTSTNQQPYCRFELDWSPAPGQTLNAQLVFTYAFAETPNDVQSPTRSHVIELQGDREPQPAAIELHNEPQLLDLYSAPDTRTDELLRFIVTNRPITVTAIEVLNPHPALQVSPAQAESCLRAYTPAEGAADWCRMRVTWSPTRREDRVDTTLVYTWHPNPGPTQPKREHAITLRAVADRKPATPALDPVLSADPQTIDFGTALAPDARHRRTLNLNASVSTLTVLRLAIEPPTDLVRIDDNACQRAYFPSAEDAPDWCTVHLSLGPIADPIFDPAAHALIVEWVPMLASDPTLTTLTPRRRLPVPLAGAFEFAQPPRGDLYPEPPRLVFQTPPPADPDEPTLTQRLTLHYRPSPSTETAVPVTIERIALLAPQHAIHSAFSVDSTDCTTLIAHDYCTVDLTWTPAASPTPYKVSLHIDYRPEDKPRIPLVVSIDVATESIPPPAADPDDPHLQNLEQTIQNLKGEIARLRTDAAGDPRADPTGDPASPPDSRNALDKAWRDYRDNPNARTAAALADAAADHAEHIPSAASGNVAAHTDALNEAHTLLDAISAHLEDFLADPTSENCERLQRALDALHAHNELSAQELETLSDLQDLVDTLKPAGHDPQIRDLRRTWHGFRRNPNQPGFHSALSNAVDQTLGTDTGPAAAALRDALAALLANPDNADLQNAFQNALDAYAGQRPDRTRALIDAVLSDPHNEDFHHALHDAIDKELGDDDSDEANAVRHARDAFAAAPGPQTAAALGAALDDLRRARRDAAAARARALNATLHDSFLDRFRARASQAMDTLPTPVPPRPAPQPDTPSPEDPTPEQQSALERQEARHAQEIAALQARLEEAATLIASPDPERPDDPSDAAPASSAQLLNAHQRYFLSRRALPVLTPGVGRLSRHTGPAELAQGLQHIDPDYQRIGFDPEPGTSGRPVPLENVVLSNTPIGAVLAHNVDARIPGPITAIIEHDVWSAHGRHVVIPHGSELSGETLPLDTDNATNQNVLQASGGRIAITWQRLTRPDGAAFRAVEVLKTADLMGRSRVPTDVDIHEIETYIGILSSKVPQALALLTVNPSPLETVDHVSQDGTVSTITRRAITARERAIDKLNEGVQEVSDQLARHLIPQPSLTIAAGTRIVVFPTEDLRLRPAAESPSTRAARTANLARTALETTESEIPPVQGYYQTNAPLTAAEQRDEAQAERPDTQLDLLHEDNPWHQEPTVHSALPGAGTTLFEDPPVTGTNADIRDATLGDPTHRDATHRDPADTHTGVDPVDPATIQGLLLAP